jgi:DNA-directed RNA polymerase specialized sigma24 family protein
LDRRIITGGEIEAILRAKYGRAVAVLVRAFGAIDVAEKAVQDAFTAAVARWPTTGMPPSLAGWIITTARNRAIDPLRREVHPPLPQAPGAAAPNPSSTRSMVRPRPSPADRPEAPPLSGRRRRYLWWPGLASWRALRWIIGVTGHPASHPTPV